MSGDELLADMMISDVLARWPQTTKVFHEHNMACVGCVIAPLASVADAAEVYGLSPDELLAQLKQAIESEPFSDSK